MPRGRRDEYYERDDTGCTIDEDEQEDVTETVRGGQARRRSPSRNAFSQRRGEDFDDRDYSDYRDRRDCRDRPESRHFPDDRDRPDDRDDPDPDGRGWFHAAHYEGDDDDFRSDPTVPARYRATRQEREAVNADGGPSVHSWQEDEEDEVAARELWDAERETRGLARDALLHARPHPPLSRRDPSGGPRARFGVIEPEVDDDEDDDGDVGFGEYVRRGEERRRYYDDDDEDRGDPRR